MKQDSKKWILTGIVGVLAVVLTVFSGIAVRTMTGGTLPTEPTVPSQSAYVVPSESEKSTEQPSGFSPSETETEAPTRPAGREYGTVRRVTEDEMTAIRSRYSDTRQEWSASGALNSSGRPAVCETAATALAENFEFVHVFCSNEKECALTFILESDGDDYAEQVLDVLKEKNVRAVFYISSYYLQNHLETVRRILLEGHTLGSLGATNPSAGLAVFGLEDQANDIYNFYTAINNQFDYQPTVFFFNNDVYTDQSLALATQMGNDVYFYTISYKDNSTITMDEDAYLWSMKSLLHRGAIYSFHVVNSATPSILPKLIDYIQTAGYKIIRFGK